MKEKLSDIISREKTLLKEIEQQSLEHFASSIFEVNRNCVNILKTMISIQSELIENSTKILTSFASIRFSLEALIQTKLLLREPEYTYKLYYSIYNHQIDKTNKLIERLKLEISIIEEFEERDIDNKKFDPLIIDYQLPSEEIIKSIKPVENELYDEADKIINIFWGDFRKHGFSYTGYFLKNKTLKDLDSRLDEVNSLKIKKAKQLLQNNELNNIFDFKRQYSRVFKELKDDRSWRQKAKETELENEYNLVYDFTSAIILATSYSFSTKNKYQGREEYMAIDMITQYSNRIISNLKMYIDNNEINSNH